MYDIPNRRMVNHRVPGVTGVDGYLKTSNLRSPLDLSVMFAVEQTIDELAYMARLDPLEFRRRNVTHPRWLDVLNAVAQAARWTPKVAASAMSDAKTVSGRGIALGTHHSPPTHGPLFSYGAAVAEIQVNKETGQVVATHVYAALDAGLAINPGLMENQIVGMSTQATSRILKEEVRFTKTNVTSLNWATYPILRFAEHPDVTPIVIQRLDQRSTGGGEEAMGAVGAAIANAFFDATGVRMRAYPMTPARVKASLSRD